MSEEVKTNSHGAVIRPEEGWKPAKDEEFNKIISECDQVEGWSVIKEQKSDAGVTKSWSSSESGNANLKVKVYSDIFKKVPIETLVDVILDPDYRKMWDGSCIECTTVEKIDDWNEINYYSAKAPSPVSNRDWLNKCASAVFVRKDGLLEYVTFNRSVVDPACPEKPGFVRACSFLTGYVMRQIVNEDGSKGSEITYYTHGEFGGWIPTWVVNMTLKTVAPSMLDQVKVACEGYEKWKAEHNPEDRSWRPVVKQ